MVVSLAASGVNEPLVNLVGLLVGVGSLALTFGWLAYLYRD
jgi:hypothetical protein